MKKLFTLIAASLISLGSMAADYVTNIGITVNGQAIPSQTRSITADKQDDGTYKFSLKNFFISAGGEVMGVGNIELSDISTTTDEAGNTVLQTEQTISIASGDDTTVPFWMGPLLGEIPLKLNGTIDNNDVIKLTLDIPLGTQTVFVALSSEACQIPNSDFELFHTETINGKSSEEPNHWHSFMSCTGKDDLVSMVSKVVHTYPETSELRPGTTGKSCVKLVSGNVKVLIFDNVANGTLTTGRLQAGSATPTSTDNCAFLDMSSTDKDGNGDPFYTELRATPDSIAVWVKFKQGKVDTKNPYATVSAIITDGTKYQDPGGNDNYVAKANSRIESNGFVWQRISCPFVYQNNGMEPKAILVTLSTNETPSKASTSDVMYIDDLTLIYNSKLKDIQMDGVTIPGFDPDTKEYNVDNIDLSTLTFEPEAEGIVQVFQFEDNDCVYITSFSEDLLSSTTYTINYNTITGVSVTEQKPAARKVVGTYNLNGQKVPANAKGIVVTKYSDGTAVKSVK